MSSISSLKDDPEIRAMAAKIIEKVFKEMNMNLTNIIDKDEAEGNNI